MKHRIVLTVCIALFALGLIGSAVVLLMPKKSTVVIRRDSEVLYTFDLSTAPDQTLVIPYGDSSNTVEIRDGAVRVKEAECPDKTCVNMGWLRSSAMPIVCLPNHLIIEFADADRGVDAISE